MSKKMSLMFATLSTILLAATAVSIAHSLLWTIIFLVLSLIVTGFGFVYKARMRRKNNAEE